MRKLTVVLAVLSTLTAGQALADGREIQHVKGHEKKHEIGRGQDQKATESIGKITLMNQALALVAPIPSDYIMDAWRLAKPLAEITDDRMGLSAVDYAESRIVEFDGMNNELATWLAGKYRAAGRDEAAISWLAFMETAGFAVQSLSEPQQLTLNAYDLPGFSKDQGNRIADTTWDNYWSQAAVHAYAARQLIKATIAAAPSDKQPMSLEARKVALGKAFFSLPKSVVQKAFRSPKLMTMKTFGYAAGKPLEFSITYDKKETMVFTIDTKVGLTVLAAGGPYFGAGDKIDGVTTTYTYDASNSVRDSGSWSSSGSETTREVEITPVKKKTFKY